MKRELTIADVISLCSVRFPGLMSSQTPNDIQLLAETAKMLPSGSTYLEIGTREGYSALAVLLANFSLQVYTVDIDPLCQEYVLGYIDEIIKSSKLGNYYNLNKDDLLSRIHFLTGDSVEVSKSWNKDIEFLFIDGDHSDQGCTNDAKAWMPFMVKEGFVGFHDYILFEHEPGMKVKTAVDRILHQQNVYYLMRASEQISLFRKVGD